MKLTKEEKETYEFCKKLFLGFHLYGETTYIEMLKNKYKQLSDKKYKKPEDKKENIK